MNQALGVRRTAIDDLLVVDLVRHHDDRGWFKENWQREKMVRAGLPDFGPVQHSVAFNTAAGVTRGFHAEPWDKLVSVISGRIFGAWVDLRPGPGFGRLVHLELDADTAVFVPRGVANSYQTLVDGTVYSYLVNAHWSTEALADYSYLNLADETVAAPWPIPLQQAVVSPADQAHPRLEQARPVPPKKTVIIGAKGQLGRALSNLLPNAIQLDLPDFDLTDPQLVASLPWQGVGVVINASAHTAVDLAETEAGRQDCWATNVTGLASLCRIAATHRIRLVHISSDYVFDGRHEVHSEDEPFSPLGVYGQTKAAGDTLVSQLADHLLIRTSWVIGEGHNFVATMARLASDGASPQVVADQFGRLTFTSDLASGITHLLTQGAASGTYNLTNAGPVTNWYEIARTVFELLGRNPDDVRPISTVDYALGKDLAPRPRHSTLDLTRIESTGFVPADWRVRLAEYLDAH